MVIANVYIDGFNLYYGALKGTPYKLLDVSAMCRLLLPERDIGIIRYFTSQIEAQPHNEQAPDRQANYFRALQTDPAISMHWGRFSSHPAVYPAYPLVYPDAGGPPQMTRIWRTEEKRSDVNLATLLLVDCVDGGFDEAVVITNDSDLTLPIDYAVNKFGKTVGVINPHRRRKSSLELRAVASWFYRTINRPVLAASQFPETMTDGRGEFHKPTAW